jgi:hypothetical protein
MKKKSSKNNNISIIIPTTGNLEILDNIRYNVKNFIKNNFSVIIVANKKIPLQKSKNLKIIFSERFKNHMEKLYHGINVSRSKYVAFVREDELINISGFIKIYNTLVKNPSLSSCQGIKFISNPYYKYIFSPHAPNNFNFYNKNFINFNIKKRIELLFKYHPECYWTVHRKTLVKKFFFLFLKRNKFRPMNMYDYYFIIYLLCFGDILFVPYPWSSKIKVSKHSYANTEDTFKNRENRKFFKHNMLYLASLFKKKRKLEDKNIYNYFLTSMKIRLNNLKPNAIYKNYSILSKLLFKLKVRLIKFLMLMPNLYSPVKFYFPISRYDIYFNSKLNSTNYNKVISNNKFMKDFLNIYSFLKNR